MYSPHTGLYSDTHVQLCKEKAVKNKLKLRERSKACFALKVMISASVMKGLMVLDEIFKWF